MTDINTVIAKYKGWKCFEQPRSGYMLQYIYEPGHFPWDTTRDKEELKARCTEIDLTQIDCGKFNGQKMPDYLNDARLYMALAVESRFSIIYDPDKKKYLAVKLRDFQYIDTVSIESEFSSEVDDYLWHSDIGTAICMAYKKLHGLE